VEVELLPWRAGRGVVCGRRVDAAEDRGALAGCAGWVLSIGFWVGVGVGGASEMLGEHDVVVDCL
jgi:hypothetical protein